MRKLTVFVVLGILAAIALVAVAFLYIDISAHRIFYYQMALGEKPFAEVKVDRYITEDKVLFKSYAKYPYSLGYPEENEKLFISKKTMTPLKFTSESGGLKGQRRIIQLIQKGEECDYLFLEHPKFIALKDFSTGENTMVFSPLDIMTYIPIVERYNFWKKGAQFFEIMIPVEKALPPMRAKLEIRYLKEEYITVMGTKQEAESFMMDSPAIPEIKISVSKYSHRILTADIKEWNTRFILVNMTETTGERIKPLVDKIFYFFKKPSEKDEADKLAELKEEVAPVVDKQELPQDEESKEVFFESGKLVLSGRVWTPEGEGDFPAVLIVSEDGPRTRGEDLLIGSLGKYLSKNGYIVLSFDSPGQGKSQGSFLGLGDKERIENIKAAVKYLGLRNNVKKDSITLIGHGGGGYLALKAAVGIPSVRSCVLLGMPLEGTGAEYFLNISGELIQRDLNALGFGTFEEGFLKAVAMRIKKHTENVVGSTENLSFFMGTKVPSGEFRDYVARRPYKTMLEFDRPIFIIYGRDDKTFDQKEVDKLKKVLVTEDERNKVAVFRDFNTYAGKMVESGASWQFSPNEAVFLDIKEWVKDNGVYSREPLEAPVEPVQTEKGG